MAGRQATLRAHTTGSEILFAFNNLYLRNQQWSDEDRKIADIVSSYWASFAANGNPNGQGLPVWPAFDRKFPTVMELGDHFEPIPVATKPRLDFWKRSSKPRMLGDGSSNAEDSPRRVPAAKAEPVSSR